MRTNRRLAQRRRRPCRMRVTKLILHWSACAGSAGCGKTSGKKDGSLSRSSPVRGAQGRSCGRLKFRLGLSTLGSVLQELGELFNFFGFLDHAHGEHLGGRGFLEFFAKLAGKLVKPLHPFAKFLLVLLQPGSFCGGSGLRVGMNFCRVRSLRGPRRRRRSRRILGEWPSILRRKKAGRRGHGQDKHAPSFKHTGLRIGWESNRSTRGWGEASCRRPDFVRVEDAVGSVRRTDVQPQEEVALRIEAIQFARARWPLFVAKAAAGTGAVGRFLPCSLLVQRLPSSRRRIAAASPVSNAAAMRQSKLVGAAGIGPGGLFGGNGGSKTPIPVRLGGGPPPRVEEACGSSSCSFSANSQGTAENATPLLKDCLEQAEDSFDDDPGRNHAARGVMRRHKLPAANGLRGAFIQPQPDALNDTDLRGAPVGANQNLQRDLSL